VRVQRDSDAVDKRINRGIPLDDDFASYLAYLISRSIHGEEGC